MINKDSDTRKAVIAGGNIEWNRIPQDGDIHEFDLFFGHQDNNGDWYMVTWDGQNALEAQKHLKKLARATEKRLGNSEY